MSILFEGVNDEGEYEIRDGATLVEAEMDVYLQESGFNYDTLYQTS